MFYIDFEVNFQININVADRTVKTLKTIGPAVFNGGFSTFLAFVLLVDSASYGFQLFFRVSFPYNFFNIYFSKSFDAINIYYLLIEQFVVSLIKRRICKMFLHSANHEYRSDTVSSNGRREIWFHRTWLCLICTLVSCLFPVAR